MKKSIFSIFLGIFIISFTINCSTPNSGTTSVGNSENTGTDSIVIGKLTDEGKSLIQIPLSLFGESETELSGAFVQIKINGVLTSLSIDPTIYFFSDSNMIAFYLSGLNHGDVLTFIITKTSGAIATYEGTVSDQEEQTATLTAETGDASPSLFLINSDVTSNSLEIDATVFGDTDNLSSASLTLTFTMYDATEETHTLNADDYYDASSDRISFSPYNLWSIHLGRASQSLQDSDLESIDFSVSRTDGTSAELSLETINYQAYTDYTVSIVALTETGTDSFTRDYTLDTVTVSYSNDCEASFVLENDFCIDMSLSEEEVEDRLSTETTETLTYGNSLPITVNNGHLTLGGFGDDSTDVYGIYDASGTFASYWGLESTEGTYTLYRYGTITETQITLNHVQTLSIDSDSCSYTGTYSGTAD